VAIAILVAMVLAMTLESLPPEWGTPRVSVLTAALAAAGLMLLTGCISGAQARRSVEWPVLIAIGAALAVGQVMQKTGAADAAAGLLLGVFTPLGPWGVLAGVYLLTLITTEIVTNNAAAALAFPIAYAAARQLGVDFTPFAVCIAVAASSGFATPIGYQTHLMVYGPGGYRFSDFLRIGVPLDLLIAAVTIALLPFVYPF
jgi:di/tricarboxylate transporter